MCGRDCLHCLGDVLAMKTPARKGWRGVATNSIRLPKQWLSNGDLNNMATIDELMQGKKPGEIKVRQVTWGADCWFEPYFRTRLISESSQWWNGLKQNECADCYTATGGGWELWQEPTATRCNNCATVRAERDDAVAAIKELEYDV